ncbi:hypothetical protein H1230_01790 [Paenibacillus sp. 19GGS1-52]|uniref:hypothetical protein n=1 Tax=Paenibacillus sp. 19GGS1-52 TaxID=2758563 RepID=UPI001EFAADF0|nr:hypothetical protein [Paenibacillus sp. 19GGS1-52]ULO07638.1 hypothetical protein H1230_01790 [Paenibacillus sp. 19GGS1-52]
MSIVGVLFFITHDILLPLLVSPRHFLHALGHSIMLLHRDKLKDSYGDAAPCYGERITSTTNFF